MIEEYNNIYKEKEEYNYNEIEELLEKNYFSLSTINFSEVYKNLEEDRKMRPNESSNKTSENLEKTIFGLKSEMRKELYQLIDESNNKNSISNLMGRKRKLPMSLPPLSSMNFFRKKI